MRRIVAALLLIVTSQLSYAFNEIVNVAYANPDTVRISLSQPISKNPTNFVVQSTNKIVIDLDDTGSKVPRKNLINNNTVFSIDVIKVDDRVRIVINLTKEVAYNVVVNENTIIIKLEMSTVYPVIASSSTDKELIENARAIIADGTNLKDAIDVLNEILLLAPADYTEEAQELIGLVYARIGQYEKAKAEDKVFLVMYPNSTRFTKVKERLIALEIAEPERKTNIAAQKTPRLGKDSRFDASVAEYYIMGSTNGQTDQESLISNTRADVFYKNDQYQLKIALRESRIDNILTPLGSRDLLTLGYVDVEDTFINRSIRVGRQNGAHGAIARFDGVMTSFGIGDGDRVNFLTGVPYSGLVDSKRLFYGASYDTIVNDIWSGEVYYNFQQADNIAERSAIGGNVRYYKNTVSALASVEYDTLYQAFNAITLQVNAQEDPYNYYMLMDRRKSPMLYADRALLIGFNTALRQPYNTVGEAFKNSGLSASDIYKFINNSTAISNAYVVGAGKQINPKWNLSVDYQITNLSSTDDTSFVQTIDNPSSVIQQPATDDTYSLNFHALGTDVLTKGHIVNAFVMRAWDSTSVTHTLTLLNGIQLDKLRVDVLLMYVNRDQLFMNSASTSASIRTNYKLQSSAIEAQFTLTDTQTSDKVLGLKANAVNASFVLGWKIDF